MKTMFTIALRNLIRQKQRNFILGLAISLGVACAAVTLNVSMALRGASSVETQDTIWAFLILGAITAISSLSFARLSVSDGESLQKK